MTRLLKRLSSHEDFIKLAAKTIKNILHNLAGRPLLAPTVADLEQSIVNLCYLRDNVELLGVDEIIKIRVTSEAIDEIVKQLNKEITDGALHEV